MQLWIIACIALLGVIVFIQYRRLSRAPYSRLNKGTDSAGDGLPPPTHKMLCERGVHQYDDSCTCVVCGQTEHHPDNNCVCMDCGRPVHDYHHGVCLKCGHCAHMWYHCRCILCGEAREEGHTPGPDGICTVCGQRAPALELSKEDDHACGMPAGGTAADQLLPGI